jgi:SAM-dependent methyltransferase
MAKAPTALGRFNTRVLQGLELPMHLVYRHRKAQLFRDHPPFLVEIGSGSGANMRYLRPGTRLIAVEPNPSAHDVLRKKAARYQLDLDIKGLFAERLDLEDACTDMVIGTLVLCTVRDPLQVLGEVRRILRPGGRFVFLEHVAARDSPWIAAVQHWVHRPWKWAFDGCHTNRDTETLLRQAGFSRVELERFNLYSPVVPIIPQIAGVAHR